MKHWMLLIALLFPVAAAGAEDHLNPEGSAFTGDLFNDYESMVVSVLGDAGATDVSALAIGMPSFGVEFAAGIKDEGGRYSVFCAEPKTQLWQYQILTMEKEGSVRKVVGAKIEKATEDIAQLEKSLPADFKDVPITRSSIAIDPNLGLRIVQVWEAMLRQTRYDPEPSMGLDGDIYHFSMKSKNQRLAGRIWSPPGETAPGMLVNIAETMRRLCAGKDKQAMADLRRGTDALAGRLGQ